MVIFRNIRVPGIYHRKTKNKNKKQKRKIKIKIKLQLYIHHCRYSKYCVVVRLKYGASSDEYKASTQKNKKK